MSKFKSASITALGVILMGISSPAYAQYCTSCSGGNCSMQTSVPVASSNQISTGVPIAYGNSTMYGGTSTGYSTTYSGSYPTSSSIPMTYDSSVYSTVDPTVNSNVYSNGSVVQAGYGSGAVLNSTYASPNFEHYASNTYPSTTVLNIPTSTNYSYDSSIVYASPTTSGGMVVNSTYAPMPTAPTNMETSVLPSTSYTGTYTSYQPSISYPSSSSTFQTSPSYSGTYASPKSSFSAPVSTYTAGSGASSGLAQQKAHQAAGMGLMGHVGGGLGGCNYEGVGWSSISRDHAISKCCYWGQRPVSQIGVARGQNGLWYACVLYQ